MPPAGAGEPRAAAVPEHPPNQNEAPVNHRCPPSPDDVHVPLSAVLAVATYVAAQMLSDIASLKIGIVWGHAVDMGTFIYPLTFTLRDLVHRALGRRAARWLIVAAGAINLWMAAYLRWVAAVPQDPAWGLGREFAAVLTPVWRLVLASIAAEVVSELADTEMYHWFVTRVTRRHAWARVVVSNAVSIPIDNLVFCLGAFAGALPARSITEIFLLNLYLKLGVTLVGVPLIYLVRKDAAVGRGQGRAG